MHDENTLQMKLMSVTFAARDVNLYEFAATDTDELPPAAAGAHIDIHLPTGDIRQYSIVQSGDRLTRYVVGIKREETGRGGSRYIHDQLRVGSIVRVGRPRNTFALDHEAPYSVLIAGGIGITPIWCMAQHLDATGRDWTLHYACRSRQDAVFFRSIRASSRASLHFDDEHNGRHINIRSIIEQTPQHAHIYCCGPTPMLDTFEEATRDWPKHQVHREFFSAAPPPGSDHAFSVTLARTGRTLQIPAGRSILDVLRAENIDVPYSCESGICGCCETRVLAGIPDHRDMVLTEAERSSNRTAMICCAGSKSETLVLDL